MNCCHELLPRGVSDSAATSRSEVVAGVVHITEAKVHCCCWWYWSWIIRESCSGCGTIGPAFQLELDPAAAEANRPPHRTNLAEAAAVWTEKERTALISTRLEDI
jgi:hypothetical protein